MELACIVLAAGFSKRFGENKLLAKWEEKCLVETVFESIPKEKFSQVIVVTRYEEIADIVKKYELEIVYNKEENPAIAVSIKSGVKQLQKQIEGCMFIVGDQPFVKKESIQRMCDVFQDNPDNIIVLSYGKKMGNPVLFPKEFFDTLGSLQDGESGKDIIRKAESKVLQIEAKTEKELMDIDTKADWLHHTK